MEWIGGWVGLVGWCGLVDWWSGSLQIGVRRVCKSILARATAMGRRIIITGIIVLIIIIRNLIITVIVVLFTISVFIFVISITMTIIGSITITGRS